MTTQEGLPALATDEDIAELRNYIEGATEPFRGNGKYLFASGLSRVLARLEAAERQVKALRKELTFVGDMAVYALKTDDDDTSGILATIRDTSRAALEAQSHDD